MTKYEAILACFKAGDELTNQELRNRTGFRDNTLSAELSRLRADGSLEYVNGRQRPAIHRLAGTAIARAELQGAAGDTSSDDEDGSILGNALRTPKSVFDLGRSFA